MFGRCCRAPRSHRGVHRAGRRQLGYRTIVDPLELRVGRDLQYIRMNGTIVGFLIGGLLYAVLDTLLLRTNF